MTTVQASQPPPIHDPAEKKMNTYQETMWINIITCLLFNISLLLIDKLLTRLTVITENNRDIQLVILTPFNRIFQKDFQHIQQLAPLHINKILLLHEGFFDI